MKKIVTDKGQRPRSRPNTADRRIAEKRQRTPRACSECTRDFLAKRADARFCSGRCRQLDCRRRKREAAELLDLAAATERFDQVAEQLREEAPPAAARPTRAKRQKAKRQPLKSKGAKGRSRKRSPV